METKSKQVGELIPIGTFEVDKLETLIISDPAYDLTTWCNGKISFAKKGAWHALVDRIDTGLLGIRNSRLIAVHEEYAWNLIYIDGNWIPIPAFVGVDSGQCGIFNAKHFNNDELAKTYPPQQHVIPSNAPRKGFYNECCMITLNLDYEVSQGLSAGVVLGGAVSESGFGDGCYRAYYLESDEGEVIAVSIEFIPDDVLEDYGYDDDDKNDDHE